MGLCPTLPHKLKPGIPQPDLFVGPTIEHFHKLPAAPVATVLVDNQVERFQDLSKDEQSAALAADPFTSWAKSDRRALSPAERESVIAGARNWLRLGQRVRIIDSPASIDGKPERRVGREGVVWRLCSPVFAEYVYVNLDPVSRERSEKIAFLELRDIEPMED